jgi:GDP-L-fucose synthase
MHEAKVSGADEVVVWGTGTPRREFLYSDDAADACVFLMKLPEEQFHQLAAREDMPPLVNVGSGQEITIREVAELVAEVVGFKGRLVFDPLKPDGTPRKLLDASRLVELGWKARTPLRDALIRTYSEFSEKAARTAVIHAS